LKYIKNFRDASAHSRPLILNVTKLDNFSAGELVTKFASDAKIKKIDRKRYLSNKKLHDFTSILILHDHYIKTTEMKNDRKRELEKLKKRCIKRYKYYYGQREMKNVFKLFCKIVDNYNS